jgi:hypothetical protein
MAVKATLKTVQVGPRWTVRTFLLALTGNYTQVAAGGETLDLSPNGITSTTEDGGKEYSGLPAYNPCPNNCPGGNYAEIMDVTAVNASGVKALNNYVIKWYAPGGGEVAGGAYPAALLNPAGGNLVQVTMVHKTGH